MPTTSHAVPALAHPAATDDAVPRLPRRRDSSEDHRLRAELGVSGIVTNVNTVRSFGRATFGDMDLTETVAVLREKVAAVQANDLSGPEATLTSQAVALDTIFNELARRAAAHLSDNLPAAEALLRLGLKAQAQCRATLQTLAELKNPSRWPS